MPILVLLCGMSMLVQINCRIQYDPTMECISKFIERNISSQKVNDFTKLNGIEVWREWSQFTEQIADSVMILGSCDVHEYLNRYETSLKSQKGQMIFVYSVHNYLKEAGLDQQEIILKVDSLMYSYFE